MEISKELFNLVVFVLIVYGIYYLVTYLIKVSNFKQIEALTNNTSSGTTALTSTSSGGIAGNASAYAASIKNLAVNLKDKLLISKYRTDYENIIMNYDDLINGLMLEQLLTNSGNQMTQMSNISTLNNAKTALNSIMKYVDAQ
jgi:hypothetical protein